jgi:peptidyl-prolyl cis-trans isomerase C
METLLLQEARLRRLRQHPEVERLLKEAHRQVLIGRLVEVVRQSKSVAVTDDQVAQFYEANKAIFKEPETFRASHILGRTEEEAKKALSRLKAGEPFPKLAEELSSDPTKAREGDVGYFSKGQLIPEFEKACEDLKAGQTSGIVKSALGYHIILLAERRPPRERSLEEVKDALRRQLASQGQQRQVEAFVQELRSKAQITIREPFSEAASPSAPPPAPVSQQQ